MPLTPEQLKEMQELEELEALEQKFSGQEAQQPSEQYPDFVKTPEERANWEQASNVGMGPAGLAMGKGLGAIGKLLGKGVGKAGDVLMQRAVGLKKYVPGVGKDLAKEGLVGTRGMLQGQVNRGLEARGSEIQALASKIPGGISNEPVGQKIAELASKRMTSSGTIPLEETKNVGQILGKARELAQGNVSGQEMAELRAMAGRRAREMGAYKQNPSAQLKSQLASAEQSGRSEALKNAYAKAFPDATNPLATADKAYSSLSAAKSGLSTPEPLDLMSLLTKPVPTALAQSASSRALIPVGESLESGVAQKLINTSPVTLQMLLGRKR